jgi:cytochrome c-type biogenesis protein CcmH/NrfG
VFSLGDGTGIPRPNHKGANLSNRKELIRNGGRAFQKNVAEFPESSNVYDSLGEAYAAAGKKELAIENYGKSLKLDPKNQNAIERLEKLKEWQ